MLKGAEPTAATGTKHCTAFCATEYVDPPPSMSPSHNEKVRLAPGLPWEKLVRKKGYQHLICPQQTYCVGQSLKVAQRRC